MSFYTQKLGKDLAPDDILIFWVNGKQGMRIEKIMPYTGKYPEFICGVMLLVGEKCGERRSVEVTIEADQMYDLHHASPQSRWPL